MNNLWFEPSAIPGFVRSLVAEQERADVLVPIDDDDCAIVKVPYGVLVTSTDFINSSPAIVELGIGDYSDLGRLIVCQNLSDLYSTGCTPTGLMLGLRFPRETKQVHVEELVRAAVAYAGLHNVPILGGDTKVGPLALYGVAVGYAASVDELLLRSHAQVDHNIWHSGKLGGFAAAVLIRSNPRDFPKLQATATRLLKDFRPPRESAMKLRPLALKSACTDITDGLGIDLRAICSASEVGAIINVSSIAVHELAAEVADQLEIEPWTLPFASGGDFELLFSAPSEMEPKLEELGFSKIGHHTTSRVIELTINGQARRELPLVGHSAARSTTFADEILKNCRGFEFE